MKIAQILPSSVPPKGYGGAARVVFWLSRALSELGHDVIVVAKEGALECQKANLTFLQWNGNYSQLSSLLPSDIDIAHYHQQVSSSLLPDIPFVVTQHGNHRSSTKLLPNTIFISHSHARNHGSDLFVYNGIPLNEYPLETVKNNSLLFMALVSWRKKNVKTAINLALDSRQTVDIAGGNVWSNKKVSGSWQYRAKIFKLRHLIKEHGQVDGMDKLSLLQSSSLLFYVVNWQEPFAIAPHEALACGTPVLAGPNGALSEYITHGENGYIVNSYKEARGIIETHNKLNENEIALMAKKCRKSAFTIEDCAKGYLDYYHIVHKGESLYSNIELEKLKYKRNRIIKITKPFLLTA